MPCPETAFLCPCRPTFRKVTTSAGLGLGESPRSRTLNLSHLLSTNPSNLSTSSLSSVTYKLYSVRKQRVTHYSSHLMPVTSPDLSLPLIPLHPHLLSTPFTISTPFLPSVLLQDSTRVAWLQDITPPPLPSPSPFTISCPTLLRDLSLPLIPLHPRLLTTRVSL
jgi:hypothetical protein